METIIDLGSRREMRTFNSRLSVAYGNGVTQRSCQEPWGARENTSRHGTRKLQYLRRVEKNVDGSAVARAKQKPRTAKQQGCLSLEEDANKVNGAEPCLSLQDALSGVDIYQLAVQTLRAVDTGNHNASCSCEVTASGFSVEDDDIDRQKRSRLPWVKNSKPGYESRKFLATITSIYE